jgi:copper resistance protein B
MAQHGGTMNWLLLVDRFEWQDGDSGAGWLGEAQGWWGSDSHKLWVKTDATVEQGKATAEDVQLLFSQAIFPFWDLQAGFRRSDTPESSARGWFVLGVQGLAPAWFNVDAALYASDEGHWQSEVELDYTLRLSQRLLLQPRFDGRFALTEGHGDDPAAGVLEATLGLRLRYEIRREFAPYVGLEWTPAGHAVPHDAAAVAGIRIWY